MRWSLLGQLALGALAAAILNGDFLFHDAPKALAVLPALLAVLLRLEFPPPGKAVGQKAPKLRATPVLDDAPLPPLAPDGELVRANAYVVVFWRNTPPCVKALTQVERVHQKCAESGLALHFVLVSRDARAEVEQQARAFAKRGAAGAGRAVAPLVFAHDADAQDTTEWLLRHSAVVLPHAFVVGADGIVIWHGQTSRKPFVVAVGQALRGLASKGGAAGGGAARQSDEGELKKER